MVYTLGGIANGGTGTILIDGIKAAEGRIDKTQPGIFSVDDLADVGTDDGTWVTDYGTSARFTGHVNKATIQTNKGTESAADKQKETDLKEQAKTAAE